MEKMSSLGNHFEQRSRSLLFGKNPAVALAQQAALAAVGDKFAVSHIVSPVKVIVFLLVFEIVFFFPLVFCGVTMICLG